MAKTGAHLRIESMGDNVLGVKLFGDAKKPEPIHFRVEIPHGDVDIVRLDNGDYWVHVRTNKPEDGETPDVTDRGFGKIVDARLDILGKHAGEIDVGDFNNELLYHVAVRLTPEPLTQKQVTERSKEWFVGKQLKPKSS